MIGHEDFSVLVKERSGLFLCFLFGLGRRLPCDVREHPSVMDSNGRTGCQLLNFVLLRNGYRPAAIKYDAGRAYARGLESWQVGSKTDSFCSIFLDCVEQEEQTLVDLIERLRHLR